MNESEHSTINSNIIQECSSTSTNSITNTDNIEFCTSENKDTNTDTNTDTNSKSAPSSILLQSQYKPSNSESNSNSNFTSTSISSSTSNNIMRSILEPSNSTTRNNSTTFTITLFLISIIYFRSKQKQRTQNSQNDSNSNDYKTIKNDTIGPRGASAVKKTTSYWVGFMSCLQNPCDAKMNPTGYIALCLAENKLVQEALAMRLMQQGTAITAFSDSIAYCYNGFLGLPSARMAAAVFLEKRFWKRGLKKNNNDVNDDGHGHGHGNHDPQLSLYLNSNSNSIMNMNMNDNINLNGNEQKSIEQDDDNTTTHTRTDTDTDTHHINPDHVAFGAGVGSLLNHLFFIIAQKGDVVLIPAPYYAAFDYDAKAIAGCVPFPVYLDNPIHGPTEKDLDNAVKLVKKSGKHVKMLLLTNPNDPLGVVYKPSTVRNAISWARSKNIHTIVDEIFALTVHKPENHPDRFHSVIEILDNKLGNDVHFLWGFSKDFGASGFRMAILYTQNTRLLQALANLNIFSGVSNPMQLIAAEIMSDDEFIDAFLEDARSQLTWSYKLCISKLEEMVVPYVPAEAGLFVYVDFSALLPEPTFEGEAKFAALVQDVARVVMTPGQSQQDCKPGMFRLCYTWVTYDVLEIAMERLSYLVLQIRRHSWEDLSTAYWRNEVVKCGTHLSTRRSAINLAELTRSSPHY